MTGKPLTPERAKKLARALSGRDSTFRSHGAVLVRVEDNRLVFKLVERTFNRELGGEDYGKVLSQHSLALAATDEARALAHYEGFCENHGFGLDLGMSVNIPSASSATFWRTVRVTGLKNRRVEVTGRYKHGGTFTKMVPKGDLRLNGRRSA